MRSCQPRSSCCVWARLINRAGSFTLIFLTIYVSQRLGYGMGFAGYCFGVFGVGGMISALVGGQLTDVVGRKPTMLLALLGGAVCLALLGVVTDRWGFLTLIFAYSLISEMYRPAASAMIGDLVTTEARPSAFSLMYIAFNLGFAVAAPIGGFLAQYSFRWLFWGDAVTTALYAMIILAFVGETVHDARRNGSGKDVVSLKVAVRHIAGDTTFLMFVFATLLTCLIFMQAFSTLPMYMNQLGFSESLVGCLMGINGILIVVTQLPVTQFLRRFDRVLMILVGEAFVGLGFGLTTMATAWPMFAITIVIWTMGEVIQAAFKQSFVADLAPARLRGRYMGAFSLTHALALSVGAPVGCWVLENLGPTVLWTACGCITLVSVAMYWLVYLRVRSALPGTESDRKELDAVEPMIAPQSLDGHAAAEPCATA